MRSRNWGKNNDGYWGHVGVMSVQTEDGEGDLPGRLTTTILCVAERLLSTGGGVERGEGRSMKRAMAVVTVKGWECDVGNWKG